MPSCSIKQCSARRNKNQPQLTTHRFPKNENLRRKWYKAIGPENVNPQHKEPRVCSLHFKESSFNKTLDVIRLREDAVPSLHIVPSNEAKEPVVCVISNVHDQEFSTITQTHISKEHIDPIHKVNQQSYISIGIQEYQSTKLTKIRQSRDRLRKRMKRLNEIIRRQAKKIENMKNIISDLKAKVINME